MTKKDFLISFFGILNEIKADYFVFGEYKNLPESTGNSDLDIYVSPKDFYIFKKKFSNLLIENNIIIASYYKNSNAFFYRLMNNNANSFWGIQIDLFVNVFYYHGRCYFPLDNIKNDIITYNNIKVLKIETAYFIGFLKEIIHNAKVKQKYQDGFKLEVNKDKQKKLETLSILYGDNFRNLIIKYLNNEEIDFKTLKSIMVKSISKHNIHSYIFDKYTLIARLFKKKTGYTIAIEGTDGSGKTFIINSITPLLEECFHNGVIYTHLRPHCLPELGVLFGTKKNIKATVTNPHAKKPSKFLPSMARWSYYLLDYSIGYLINYWLKLHTKSKVVIFDRYYYDNYIDQKRLRTSLPKWIIRIGEFFIHKPDLVICLGGDPKIIYERKPETSFDEVKRQTKALKEFCKTRSNAVWVDTTIQPNISITTAIEAILKMCTH